MRQVVIGIVKKWSNRWCKRASGLKRLGYDNKQTNIRLYQLIFSFAFTVAIAFDKYCTFNVFPRVIDFRWSSARAAVNLVKKQASS